MRRFIFALVSLLCLIASLQGQWEILNEGVKGDINTIDFVNDNIGWIGGSDGLLLKTQDGGQTWQSIPLDKNWSINKIDFLDESVGWAIGNVYYEAIILKTYNGGQTWSVQASWPNADLNLMRVMNTDVVYAVGSQYNPYSFSNDAKIFKTADGGVKWVDITLRNSSRNLQSIWFLNSQVGLVTGFFHSSDTAQNAIVWSTNDGGMTWEEIIISELSWIRNLQFVNDSTAYFLAGTQTQSSSYSMLCKTTDRFKSWSIIRQSDYTNSMSSFFYLGSGRFCGITGWPRGYRGAGGFYSYILKSTDGGMTWQQKLLGGAWNINRIYFYNEQVGFSIGGGSILKTMDGGENWCVQRFSYSFENICFIDRNKGFASGGWLYTHRDGSGDMFVTEDGGRTWQPTLWTNSKIESCVFVNTLIGFAISRVIEDGSWIDKTVDGGKNWTDIYIRPDSTSTFEGKDIFFINGQRGWAVGFDWSHGPAITETTDGGENWEQAWRKNTGEGMSYLNSICFVNDSTGWAVGDSGMIVKRTASGQWEEQPILTDLPLNDVFFSDEKNGWIAGGYSDDNSLHPIFLRTTDSGKSWEKTPDRPYLIHDIYFHDAQRGWAVGYDESGGVILETIDGGEHWTVAVDSLIGQLKALSYRDGFLWAVGDYGLVLSLEIPTAIENDRQSIPPLAFELFQNYPNPFNAKTVILYTVGASRGLPVQVELGIYNILGQKIAALVSEKQPAGSYKVEWDASGFSSGVYLYRLQAGDFISIKKLLLLK